ncbi:hypothetical protein MMC15_002316 [Xylographa vitiligo]|nr:hypothetical protein [Xylographa vitiligo]
MLLRKLRKRDSTASLRSYGHPAKTPSPAASLDAPIDSTVTSIQPPPTISSPTIASVQHPPTTMTPPSSSIQPLPTIMSPPTISSPSTTDSPLSSISTDTSAPNLSTPEPTTPIYGANSSTPPLATPTRAAPRSDHTSTPLTNSLVRKLHEILDKQAGLSRGYRSREAEIDKTRELIVEMTKPSKIVEMGQQNVEKWLVIQERWIKWLEKDMEKVKAEFLALVEVEVGLRERIEGKSRKGVGKLGEDEGVEALPEVLSEVTLEENGEGVRVVDGAADGEKQKDGGEGADGKSEDSGDKEGVDGPGS